MKPTIHGRHAARALQRTLCAHRPWQALRAPRTQGGRAQTRAERVTCEAYHTRTACSACTPAHAVCPPSAVRATRTQERRTETSVQDAMRTVIRRGATISYNTKPHTRPTCTIRRPRGRSKETGRDKHRDYTWAAACRDCPEGGGRHAAIPRPRNEWSVHVDQTKNCAML